MIKENRSCLKFPFLFYKEIKYFTNVSNILDYRILIISFTDFFSFFYTFVTESKKDFNVLTIFKGLGK